MIRLAALALVLALGLPVASADAGARLRSDVTVDGPFVTLGDLFTGVGDAADTAVFQSPDPGTTGEVSTSRVLAAAARHGVEADEVPSAKVNVTRASRAIEAEEVESALREEIAAATDAEGELDIRLDHVAWPIHVEANALAGVVVTGLDQDPDTGRFSARIGVPGSKILPDGFRVSGRTYRIVELPVPQRRIARGETIGTADVAMERIALSDAPDDAVRRLDLIVGKSARSNLREGAPIAEDRLMEPIVVHRNDAVTIVYRTPGLLLTVRGRALREGAKGDLVTVMNAQSNRTIEAVVAAPGQVVVEPPHDPAATTMASN